MIKGSRFWPGRVANGDVHYGVAYSDMEDLSAGVFALFYTSSDATHFQNAYGGKDSVVVRITHDTVEAFDVNFEAPR